MRERSSAAPRLCSAPHSVTHSVRATMFTRKPSHVWSYFSSTNSQEAVCDICKKKVRCCGNTTNLVKHLRSNHASQYETMRQSEEESAVSPSGAAASATAARARQTCLAESFGATGRHYPGMEKENMKLKVMLR